MRNKDAYAKWSKVYDTDDNKTRDLEAIALRKILAEVPFDICLELGCGTGKNTEWLMANSDFVHAVDLSEEMLAIAKQKFNSDKVRFEQADITEPWAFADHKYDLITCSLLLEHVENLDPVFKKLAFFINLGGYIYIGELHPAKQYTGSKAKFMTEEGEQQLTCYTHHVSEFIGLAKKYGLDLVDINEFFDDNDRTTIPRIFTLLLRKSI